MKQALTNGGKIDVLTPDELGEQVSRILSSIKDLSVEEYVMDVQGTTNATAGGAIANFEIFEVPLGNKCEIHRIHIMAPGATPAVPLAPAGAWLGLYRNDVTPMNLFEGFSGNIAPVIRTQGSDCRVLFPGNRIILSGASLGANQAIYVTLQILLRPFEAGVND